MSLRFDDKGKFFTEVVSKEAIPVIIQTPTNHIQGNIHIRPGERLRDAINESEVFIAITEVVIYDLAKKEQYRSEFLALNRAHIIWILPTNPISSDGDEDGPEGES